MAMLPGVAAVKKNVSFDGPSKEPDRGGGGHSHATGRRSLVEIAEAHDAETAERKRLQKRFKWVIDPRTNKWIIFWDMFTGVALVFTALVTPFEVSFLDPPGEDSKWTDHLFLANRLVDLVFIFDMLLQFRLAYKTSSISAGTKWHTSARDIAHHYVFSKWAMIDLFSVLTSLFDIVDFEDAAKEGRSLTALRAVRVLRLAKLIRLLRGSRILKTWEMRVSINYAYLSLAQISGAIVIGCHWIACVWGLEASFQPLESWPRGKGYCVPWGDPDQQVALTMLDSSCTLRVHHAHQRDAVGLPHRHLLRPRRRALARRAGIPRRALPAQSVHVALQQSAKPSKRVGRPGSEQASTEHRRDNFIRAPRNDATDIALYYDK